MGGNAFDMVSRIEQENIIPTLKQEVEPILAKLGIKNYKLLGSALKKDDSSGDLDIGIEWSEVLRAAGLENETNRNTTKEIINKLFQRAGLENIPLKFFGSMATIAIPIVGQEGEYVQTDLMFFDDLKYGEYAKLAPDKGTSKYKSVIKNFLFYAIFPALRFDEEYRDDELIGFKQYMVNDNGMFIKTTSRINQKNPDKKLLKNFKVIDREFITSDWNKIWNELMGPEFKKSDWNSFESLYDYMKSNKFKYRERLPEIIENFKETMNNNQQMEIPKEIK